MKTVLTLVLALLGWGIGSPAPLKAQDYIKELVGANKYLGQGVAHFSNGDVVIGNSSIEALQSGGGGTIYLTRMDVCGNISWSRAYHREEEYLEIKDVLVNQADEIFAYGSAYIGLDELIFLFKADTEGNILKFQLYEPETVDHFSYNIDLRNGLLMAYGLILDFNTKKYGFVAVFNESLTFLRGVKFTPFESVGEARILSSGEFLCRSGPLLIKLDAQGQWIWGQNLDPGAQLNPIAGPLELADGYLLEAYGEGHAFFYKLDKAGQLLWTSERFPAKAIGADLDLLPNGQIVATYSAGTGSEARLCYLILSAEGQIVERRSLQTDHSINPGQTHQTAGRPDRRFIAVDQDRFTPANSTLPAFILQMSWPPGTNDCFSWTPLPASQLLPNDTGLTFSPLDTVTTSTVMNPVGSTMIRLLDVDAPYLNACDDGSGPDFITIDSLVDCSSDWEVSLPGPDFVWTDGHPQFTRSLTTPGTYQARNENCGDLTLYEYTLRRSSCPCPVYLPTAFSPNQDGTNDLYQCYPGCELSDLRIRIFNRWGILVFDANSIAAAWDGTYRGRIAESGVYLVHVEYAWRDETGGIKQAALSRELTLIR